MFADEKVSHTISGLYPDVTHWLIPVFVMPLGIFVAFIQTFVFILLSQLYLSEVSHAPHEEHDEHGEYAGTSEYSHAQTEHAALAVS
jgi:hypothetical protein